MLALLSIFFITSACKKNSNLKKVLQDSEDLPDPLPTLVLNEPGTTGLGGVTCIVEYAQTYLHAKFDIYNKKDPNTPRASITPKRGTKNVSYRFKAPADVENKLELADVADDAFYCVVTLNDNSRTVVSSPSAEVVVVDTPPSIDLVEGKLEQTLLSSQDLEELQLSASDSDLNEVSLEILSSTCDWIQLDKNTGRVFGKAPTLDNTETLECETQFISKTSVAASPGSVFLKTYVWPNNKPKLTCNKSTLRLAPGASANDLVACQVSDSDDENHEFKVTGCGGLTMSADGKLTGQLKEVESCTASIEANDGNSSDTVTVEISVHDKFQTILVDSPTFTQLPSADIRAAVSDSGVWYVGANGGVGVSTDSGTTWKTLTTTNGQLPSQNVKSLSVSSGKLWIATDSGLCSYSLALEKCTNKTTQSGLGSNTVNQVVALSSNIYAATQAGLSVSTDSGGSWTTKTVATDGLASDVVNDIYIDGFNVYVATGAGLSVSTDAGMTWNNISSVTGDSNPEAISSVTAETNKIYVGGSFGVALSTDGGTSFTTLTTADGLGSNVVSSVKRFGGKLFAATNGGLSVSADDATFTNATFPNGGTDWEVANIHFDGTRYFASTRGGLGVSTDAVTWDFKSPNSGLLSADFRKLSAYGSKLYASSSFGLSVSANAGQSFQAITKESGLASNTVHDILGLNNSLFVATNSGLSISTNSGTSWSTKSTVHGLPTQNINGVCAIGNKTFVATNLGVAASTDGGQTWASKNVNLPSLIIGDIKAFESTLFAATAGGLAVSYDNAASWFVKTAPLGSLVVHSFYIESPTTWILATDQGVAISKDAGVSWVLRSAADGLPSSHVTSVHVSGGVIYASTPLGVAVTADDGENWKSFGTEDGLASHWATSIMLWDNKLYVATKSGLSVSK